MCHAKIEMSYWDLSQIKAQSRELRTFISFEIMSCLPIDVGGQRNRLRDNDPVGTDTAYLLATRDVVKKPSMSERKSVAIA